MKKGKVFGKKQIALSLMVVALAGAVWLNMKYSATEGGFTVKGEDNKQTASYLGEATFVDNKQESESVQTGGKADEDYLATAKKDRDAARSEAISELEDTVKDAKVKDSVKTAAVEKLTVLTTRSDTEASIETLLKAKGFKNTIAIIGDNDINVVVKADSLTAQQTLQIQDIADSQSGYTADKIKILTVK
jgi:stage III sporulation protein AH